MITPILVPRLKECARCPCASQGEVDERIIREVIDSRSGSDTSRLLRLWTRQRQRAAVLSKSRLQLCAEPLLVWVGGWELDTSRPALLQSYPAPHLELGSKSGFAPPSPGCIPKTQFGGAGKGCQIVEIHHFSSSDFLQFTRGTFFTRVPLER